MRRFSLGIFGCCIFAAFGCAVQPDATAVAAYGPDYVLHGATFLALSVTGFLAFPQVDRALLWALLALFGGGIEFIQGMPAIHRDADWRDWLTDMTVTAAVLAVLPPRTRMKGQ